MGINFDALPQSNDSKPTPGFYRAKVIKATMATPKDETRPDYLRLECELSTYDRKPKGKLFDNLFESEAPALQFKLGRLNAAAGLNITGNVSLKDFGKVLVGKEYVVDTKLSDDGKWLEVDLFGGQCYHPLSEFGALMGVVSDEDVPFDTEEPTTTGEATGNVEY